MRVTVVIPCYNQVQYLDEAIQSALAQTEPCEVIVVDDGSPDNTKEIAAKYEKVRLISQTNRGLASARNTGLMNTNTEWVLFLDADDILNPNCVSELLFKASQTNADVVAPSLIEFGLSNNTVILKEEVTLADMRLGNHLPYCALIKTEMLRKVGGYSPRYDVLGGYEDYALWVDLLGRGKRIATTSMVLFHYRTKADSMITTAKKNHKNIMEQMYKDFPAFLPV